MNRLSKREYVLISLLVVVLIWFLGWNQVVRPQMDRLKKDGERLSRLETEREQLELYRGPEQDTAAARAGGNFFYTGLDDVEIDRLLLQMAAESGADIRRMEIGAPAPVEQKLPGSEGIVYTEQNKVPLKYIQVSMELEAETFDQIAAMADQIYSLDKSVVTDQMEAAAVYGRDSLENPEFQGVKCTMEVCFYYREGPGAKEDGA